MAAVEMSNNLAGGMLRDRWWINLVGHHDPIAGAFCCPAAFGAIAVFFCRRLNVYRAQAKRLSNIVHAASAIWHKIGCTKRIH